MCISLQLSNLDHGGIISCRNMSINVYRVIISCPKLQIFPKCIHNQFLHQITSSAFMKKRPSISNKESLTEKEKVQSKEQHFKDVNLQADVKDVEKNLKNMKLNDKKDMKLIDPKGKGSEIVARKKPNLIKKKISVKHQNPPKIESKLEVCSEEAKKKLDTERKIEKEKQKKINCKKKEIKDNKAKKKIVQIKEKQEIVPEEIMEEEKCNSENDLNSNFSQSDYNFYENEQFEEYESEDDEEIDYSLSSSESVEGRNYNSYEAMLKELRLVGEMVEKANGKIQNLPMIGSKIQELLEFSAEIRDDDSSLETKSNCSAKSIQPQPLFAIDQDINLTCLYDHGQLENLRIQLEELFGVDSIINIHNIVEKEVIKNGLDFNEEQAIHLILANSIDLNPDLLRKYFRYIVTVVSLENQII